MEKESIPVALEDMFNASLLSGFLRLVNSLHSGKQTNKQTIDFNIKAQLRSLFSYRAFSGSVAML